MLYAAILAGGVGSRMGNTEKPKQFLLIGSKPVIVHTVEKFLLYKEFDRVIVATPAEWVGYTERVLAESITDLSRIRVVAGGSSRNETLMNAIAVIEAEGKPDEDAIIVTHDAVRPFVTQRIIKENLEAVQRSGASDTAFPATDTILISEDGIHVSDIPERSKLLYTQTPQSFRVSKLKELYQSLTPEEKNALTDAAGIFVMKGEKVEIVRGESFNIKITYPYDIQLAEIILKDYNFYY